MHCRILRSVSESWINYFMVCIYVRSRKYIELSSFIYTLDSESSRFIPDLSSLFRWVLKMKNAVLLGKVSLMWNIITIAHLVMIYNSELLFVFPLNCNIISLFLPQVYHAVSYNYDSCELKQKLSISASELFQQNNYLI